MPGRIPQSFIDELLSRTDIVDVVDTRVSLKKKGRDYMACCPFHDEKTPSFSVSQGKQFYYCFGCGAHGNALGFLMEYDHMDFLEAVEELAARAGLDVPREAGASDSARDLQPLYEIFEAAARFYQRQLREHPEAQRATDYLKSRGLTGAVAKTFGIGFAPPGWDHLLRHLGNEPPRRRALLQAGLVIEKDGDNGHCYDRFRDRIMFPIHDRRGRVIGFGGRVLGDGTPKYLNSPESAVFHKGRELYGLYEARQALRELPRLLVVEGYMDVVALAQHGIAYAVATLGTATTRDHLEQLFRAVAEVVFCFDGDQAGRTAAWRAVENALPVMREGRQARFLFLPEGEDPDSLVRKEGAERFEARIADSIPFSEFLLENLARRADTRSVDGRARMVELARPLVSKLPAGVYRDMVVEALAQRAGIAAERLKVHLGDGGSDTVARSRPTGRGTTVGTPSLVRRAIAHLVRRPSLASQAGEPGRFEGLALKGTPLLIELIELLRNHPQLSTGGVLERWRDRPEERHLARLAQEEPLIQGEQLEADFQDTLDCLDRLAKEQRSSKRLQELSAKPFESLTRSEKEEYNQLVGLARAPR